MKKWSQNSRGSAGAETQEIRSTQPGKEAFQLSLLTSNTNFRITTDYTNTEVVKVMNSAR
jgi:hypothetical protein